MALDIKWVEQNLYSSKDFYTDYNSTFILNDARYDINRYYEIIRDYLELMKYISEKHPDFFRNPKGHPYYWIGFFLFKIKYYEQAIFYLDAALAEDKKCMPEFTKKENGNITYGWRNSGAALFFKLYKFPDNHPFAFFNFPELKDKVKKIIEDFNSNNKETYQIDIETDFVGKFIYEILKTGNTAVATALYSFIMEKSDIDDMIKLKSDNGGTIEPMILHLLKGSVLFESLVKIEYYDKAKQDLINEEARKKGISPINVDADKFYVTLSNIFFNNDFKSKMGYTNNIKSNASDINEIIVTINKFSIVDSFTCTAKLRNTSAHNLCWDSRFISNYSGLYNHIIYSILYYIYNQYVKP